MHVISELGGGGVERLLVKSLAWIDRRSLEHHVVCVSRGGVYEAELRALGIPCTVLQRRARFDPSVITQLAGLMRSWRPDVVHTLNFTANAWGRVAARLAGVPRLIAHERGTAWTETPAMRLADRLLYPLTDLLLANSQAARSMLIGRIGLSPQRIRVLHNGVPEPPPLPAGESGLRQRLGLAQDAVLVGAVGRLDTAKGHRYLLEAAPLVWAQAPDVHFVIIGDGPLGPALRQQAQALGLDPARLHFTGFLPNAPAHMAGLDLLAHPAIREALGNVLIEAGFQRLPVVASRVDGIPEVVVDGQTGLLVDGSLPVTARPDERGATRLPALVVDGHSGQLRPPLALAPPDLAEAILRLAGDPALRQEMGARARQRVEDHFHIRRYVQDLERIYNQP